jgi:trimethylamine--corrinoid protein Co-methyltransferase
MQSFGQGFVSMSAPSKEMYRLIASKKINHEANPVLSWHVSNVQMDRDAADNISDVVAGEGHFLGQPDTLARMSSDFVYPQLADRRTPSQWEQAGSQDIRTVARQRTMHLLATHFPSHLGTELQGALRATWDIRLPQNEMRAT